MTQTLSIRLGHEGPYFYINGNPINPGLDYSRYDEFEGGNPYLFYRDIATWAQDMGVTHIIDENLSEMDILTPQEAEEALAISQYTILANVIEASN